jgi:hypothetical protein
MRNQIRNLFVIHDIQKVTGGKVHIGVDKNAWCSL